MKTKKRMLFGVIAAAISDITQRELLLGIIEEAKKHKNPDLQTVYESSIITSKGSEKNDKQKQITKKNTMG